jgi:hypothetical protein
MLVWLLGTLGLTGGGIGIAALLGGGPAMLMAAKWLLGWLKHATFLQVACVALAIALAVDHGALLVSHHEAASWKKQFNAEHEARKADQDAYRKAQADAQAKNLATVAKDKAERERITHDVSQSYEAELGRLRADLARRLHASPSEGAPGKPDLPNVSEAPGGPDGSSRVSIPTSLYVHGAELELQLERLQQWVNEQLKVDPNK